MAYELPPFSARIRGAHKRVDNDCPETARIGLVHLLGELVDKRYVDEWKTIRSELERIARVRFGNHELDPDELMLGLPWEKVFDFCERLYSHIATGVVRYDPELDDTVVVTTQAEAQEYVAKELQRLFAEEGLAFEFTNGLVHRRGRRHTAEQVVRAEQVLGDPRLSSALKHFNKSLRYFRNVSKPDPENAVKEAVCAVEATTRALFPNSGTTLGEVVKNITGDEVGQLPKTIAKTFDGLYGFRSGGEGVAHGGASGGPVTKELAEYALAVAASQIVLLVDLEAASEPEVPF